MKIKNDDLGCRMKKYEYVTRTHLIQRMPVIIRIDVKSFHTFTKGFDKPFDEDLILSMQNTMKYLCENIQGCVLGYTQSDEISLVLVDYQKLNSNGWFDYNIQKCSSVAASMTTMNFNKAFHFYTNAFYTADEVKPYYKRSAERGALFDARCFNIPKEEVCNYFLWRQNDAVRNSISMVAQANFSHKELQNKSSIEMLEMLSKEKNVKWDEFPSYKKYGSCCIKKNVDNGDGLNRKKWEIDNDIPIFKKEGRDYIDSRVII